ncbi:MAG: pitrilysin family protein [Proteobacteria bacterium]|nr:pitrilysin family protein [Pseudomonadota bacterium]MDA0993070.1 pitrilysin family protein [Pseudomonadota bacterium]
MTNLKNLLVTAVALSFVAAIFAQEKEVPPAGGTPKDFTLPATNSFGLENGLQGTLVEFGSVPKATIRIIVRSGNLNEGKQTWLADLSADFLIEGTSNRSAEDIAKAAAAMGGQVNVGVGEDQTTISADVLAEFAPDMVKLLADIVRNPAFPASELERLKRDRLRQLSIAKTQPQQMAVAEFRKALYGDHPYGRMLPAEEQLAAYTLDDARNFYNNNFGAQRTQIYVAGMFDAAATRAAIESGFTDWRKGPDVLIDLPKRATGKVVVDVVDRPDASQSDIMLGLPTIAPGHEDWIPLQITNSLLGGSFSSRITSNIREDKGYTYSPFSSISTRYQDAYWVQSAAVTTDVTGAALKEIVYEIDNLQKNPPTAEELDGIKNYAAGIFVLQNSTPGGIINMLSYLELQELPDTYLTDYVSEVYAVTPRQVSEIAQTYLREEDMTLAVIGDRSQVSEQVEPYVRGEEE